MSRCSISLNLHVKLPSEYKNTNYFEKKTRLVCCLLVGRDARTVHRQEAGPDFVETEVNVGAALLRRVVVTSVAAVAVGTYRVDLPVPARAVTRVEVEHGWSEIKFSPVHPVLYTVNLTCGI